MKVKVNLNKTVDNSYEIIIGRNLLNKIPGELKKKPLGNNYLIITDSNIEKLFGRKLLQNLRKNGLKADIISLKPGEQSKNLKVFEQLQEKTHALGVDRKSAIIALGGGVVGDIAGFVAASYMRGINYIQIPTSLLADVDSSIGGKVAVDLSSGKNIVGAFHQPKKVYIDASLLKKLPQKELLNGMAEVIKHAAIADKTLFVFLERNMDKLLARDEKVLIDVIKRNCEIKGSIVERDEKEAGLRKIVNFGHTAGHAIETLTHYKKFTHGEAIAIGMCVAAKISADMKMISRKEAFRIVKLIENIGLPTQVPNIPTGKIINELKKDKKAVRGKAEFVLLSRLGKAEYGISVPEKTIKEAIEEFK